MLIRLIFLCALLCGLTFAQEATSPLGSPSGNAPAKVQRRAMLEFTYEPEAGRLEIKALNRDGSQAFPLESLRLTAIGDRFEQGRKVTAAVEGLNDSSFRVQLGLPEGAWNLVFEAVAGGERLTGSHVLGVGRSPLTARLALVRPPDREVSRLSLVALLVFVIPVALGLLAVGWAVMGRMRAARAEA